MKTRKSLCALFMVMLLVLSSLQGIASAAGSGVTKTVSAGFGDGMEQHVTVNGNVEVDNEINAVFVEAHAPEDAEDKNASVVVNGNVTFTNETSASAVYVEGRNGNASAEISGDLSATSNESINGVETWGHSFGNGEASVTIGGSVTAESRSSNATGIDSDTGSVHVTGNVTAKGVSSAYGVESYSDNDITIGGNVNAEAETPTGIYAYSSTQSNVDVKGSVSATGKHVTGLQLETYGGPGWTYIEGQGYVVSELSGDLSVTVENGILATSTSTETNGGDSANGISFYNDGGKLVANINGNVEANSASGDAIGVLTDHSSNETGNRFGNGISEILVHGNVISNGVGIALDTFGENTDVNVLVENEIQAKKVGVAINRAWFADEESKTEPKLTVWKIKLNDNGKIVEWGNSDFNYGGDEEEKTIEDFEKNIMYIAKVEQPGKGGTIKVVDKDGKDLQKSYDLDIAHEGDRLYVNVDTERNYEVVNIYNGLDKTDSLSTDEDGKYYIVVPKGGGIYISAELKFVTDDLTITADDATKEYDGTALTKDSYTSSGLAEGDTIESVTINGSRTEAGESDNVPSAAKIIDANGQDVTSYYNITYKKGKLTVTAAQAPDLTDDQKPDPKKDLKEDGKEQVLVLDPEDLPEGYTLEYSTDGGETWTQAPVGTESGEYKIEVRYKADENHTDFFGDIISVTIEGVYNLTESDGNWTKGSKKTCTFRIKKAHNDENCFDNHTGVIVDGKPAEKGKDYTATKGSTIITFSADFLETLSVGEHLIKVTFKDGETSFVLKVLEAIATPTPTADTTPTTGDTGMPILWAVLILISLAGASAVVMRRRKQA